MHFNRGFLKKVENKLSQLSPLGFISCILALSLLTVITYSTIGVLLQHTIIDSNLIAPIPERSTVRFIISSVILAPIIETLLFQHLPYYFYKKGSFLKSKPIALLIIPAIIFGAFHSNSILFMITTFFIGLVYMMCYISRANKSVKEAYWLVAASHALHNLFVFLI